jgi:hypothetical protein
MNPNYFTEIKKQKEVLDIKFCDGCCLVTSQALPGRGKEGTVCEVPNNIAARLLTEGSHRLAGADETNAYRAAQILQRATTNDPLTLAREQFNLLSGRDAK